MVPSKSIIFITIIGLAVLFSGDIINQETNKSDVLISPTLVVSPTPNTSIAPSQISQSVGQDKGNDLEPLIIGWLLGILSLIISPFIVEPIKNWQNKKNLKQILKADINQKKAHLKSIEQRINTFYGAEKIDVVITILKTRPDVNPVIKDRISEDFYKRNYERILQYFNKETNLLEFYEHIRTMNTLIDTLETNPPYRHDFILAYCVHLKTCLYESISI